MTKDIREIQVQKNMTEDETRSKEDEKLMGLCKKEIDELNNEAKKGEESFVKFVTKKYEGYHNKKVEYSEESLRNSNLKKTLIKVCFHYHPDR